MLPLCGIFGSFNEFPRAACHRAVTPRHVLRWKTHHRCDRCFQRCRTEKEMCQRGDFHPRRGVHVAEGLGEPQNRAASNKRLMIACPIRLARSSQVLSGAPGVKCKIVLRRVAFYAEGCGAIVYTPVERACWNARAFRRH